MILTKKEIENEIKNKRIKIEPFDAKNISSASIDLTLDNQIRVFLFNEEPIEINDETDYKKFTKIIDISKGYMLKPGELILGITKETITLSDNICGWLNSRSRFARIGLMSHITAPFINPGVSNKQILEIYNANKNSIKIYPKLKICQLVLEECKGNEKYTGKFKNQVL